jgi:hypothetical protein
MSILSDNQFHESVTPEQSHVEAPLSLSSSTNNSAAQATAWRNSSLGGGRPLSFSSKTRGTTFNWDDAPKASLPSSDTGASFGGKE